MVYSLKVMKPEPSASISLKSLAMFRSDTPRAERSRAVNSSRVIFSSSSVSNSCKVWDKGDLHFSLSSVCTFPKTKRFFRFHYGSEKCFQWYYINSTTVCPKSYLTLGPAKWLCALHNRHTLLTWHYPSLSKCLFCSFYSTADTVKWQGLLIYLQITTLLLCSAYLFELLIFTFSHMKS